LLPALALTTRYYLTRAQDGDNENDQSINVEIALTNWNPYAALLEIKSRSILVDIARTAHRQKMATGLSNIAKAFYSIAQIKKRINSQKKIAAFRDNTYEYGVSKNERGTIDPVKVRLWRSNVMEARLTIKELEARLNNQILVLKQLIGYHPDFYLPLDTRDAESQILGGFNGGGVTFSSVQALNHDLKLLAKKEQLQSNSVTAAYMALVPQPTLVMENLTGQQDRASGFNLAIGLNYLVWDGFRRVREIKRQKLEARKIALDRKRLSESLYGKYRRLLDTIDLSRSKSTHVRERVKLAELAEERALSRYKSGDLSYEDYIQSKIERAAAVLKANSQRGEKVEALLDLATMAGGLNRHNVRIRF
jgi:outer membrane protein TolC